MYYTLAIRSLLTDTPRLSQRYAIDGAIQIKSVEENTKEREVPSLTD